MSAGADGIRPLTYATGGPPGMQPGDAPNTFWHKTEVIFTDGSLTVLVWPDPTPAGDIDTYLRTVACRLPAQTLMLSTSTAGHGKTR
ncbi:MULTISPECIES: hypothetical protein [Mycobacteriaceae]|uniref:Uncharacterized protein n=3 Tax=Mycobacteriaceae TaxID=1762 RepID=A0ABR5FMQ4_9MYCO|nr:MULTISPECIES: hypothetical protein [Mycobacteriaceae]KLI09413.1 hypothetical protein AA982_05170 [Mycolicibacterium senegalense]KLO47806.1 hypothetical protein ABW05_32195 [Mycolicibacterium senegalense]MBP2451737.1 hypothetical protein [Mycolicibacterium lutetiense]OHT83426.1 hypothetical protein BKG61_28725 [Mycobacterium syngnathidarum]OLT97658.1 hypothetical protein BKG60_04600 [Mycobacterium syngnathidarum]